MDFNAWTDLFGSIIRNGFNRILNISYSDTTNGNSEGRELEAAASVVDALESLEFVDRSMEEISFRTAIEDGEHAEYTREFD